MKTYCLGCKNSNKTLKTLKTLIILVKKVIMIIKKIIDKSRCANCMAKNSRFLKQKHNKKRGAEIVLTLNFSYSSHYKTY